MIARAVKPYSCTVIGQVGNKWKASDLGTRVVQICSCHSIAVAEIVCVATGVSK